MVFIHIIIKCIIAKEVLGKWNNQSIVIKIGLGKLAKKK